MRKLMLVALAFAAAVATTMRAQPSLVPGPSGASVKFAVIGDNGTGKKPQYEVGEQLNAARAAFPFEFVVMVGDNLYGTQEPQDFVEKFERPYAPLIEAGVRFYAALGNHDRPENRFYPGFNMNGARYYTHVKQHVRFIVLDTNLLDAPQLAWAEDVLRGASEPWKIAVFHHPLYSNAKRHGSNVELRVVLEPLLTRYGVTVAFSGHEHVYERLKPQKGITYFTQGSSGQLRKGDMRSAADTAAAFDEDQSFTLVDVTGDRMTFRTVSRTGRVVDAGVIERRRSTSLESVP